MARERKVVPAAPAADIFRECLDEAGADVVVIVVAHLRIFGLVPEDLRKAVEQVIAVGRAERLRQIVGKGKDHVPPFLGVVERLLCFELRLVGENRGDGLSEFRSERIGINVVRQLDKAVDRALVQRIDIRTGC